MYKLNYYCYYYYIVCMLTSVWESAQNIYCVVFTPWVPEMNSFYVCLLKYMWVGDVLSLESIHIER